ELVWRSRAEQRGRVTAAVHAEPVLRREYGAIHAGGPDWDLGRDESVWVCGRGSRQLQRPIWISTLFVVAVVVPALHMERLQGERGALLAPTENGAGATRNGPSRRRDDVQRWRRGIDDGPSAWLHRGHWKDHDALE